MADPPVFTDRWVFIMITKKQWKSIKKGDLLVFTSGRIRYVISEPGKSNNMLSFLLIGRRGITSYTYSDLKHKIIGRLHVKYKSLEEEMLDKPPFL